MRESAAAHGPAFTVVSFDLEHAPSIERKADPPKEKKKAAKPAAEQAASGAAAAPTEKKGKKVAKYHSRQNEAGLFRYPSVTVLTLVNHQLISSLLKPMDEHTEDAKNEEDAARLPV